MWSVIRRRNHCQTTCLTFTIGEQEKKSRSVTYRKEICLVCCPKENDSHHCQVATKDNSSCKDLCQLPGIRMRRWFHPILGYCHNCTWHRVELVVTGSRKLPLAHRELIWKLQYKWGKKWASGIGINIKRRIVCEHLKRAHIWIWKLWSDSTNQL